MDDIVYRHLLFNRLFTPNDALDPSILRLGILLILFDVYITWARIERANSPSASSSASKPTAGNNFSSAPIITQYLFFLTLNVVATVVQHGVIRGLARVFVQAGRNVEGSESAVGGGSPNVPHQPHHVRSNSSPLKLRGSQSQISLTTSTGMSASTTALDDSTLRLSPPVVSHHHTQSQPHFDASPLPDPKSYVNLRPNVQASPSAISTALLVSSCTKLFPILLVIWPTTANNESTSGTDSSSTSTLAPFAHRATSYIGWIVLLNNIEALLILLECGYMLATALAVAGLLSRWIVEGWLLGLVGLVREGEGPVGDVVAIWRWFVGSR